MNKLDVLFVCTTKSVTCLVKFLKVIFATDFFGKVVQQQYVGEVGTSIIVMLQINSV